jgi:hypothetical protein
MWVSLGHRDVGPEERARATDQVPGSWRQLELETAGLPALRRRFLDSVSDAPA